MTVTPFPRQSERCIVLAAMHSGRHIQVGAPQSHEGAHALYRVLDSDHSGWRYDLHGHLKPGRERAHAIKGEPVRFYRVREGSHEFGAVETIPVGHIARAAR